MNEELKVYENRVLKEFNELMEMIDNKETRHTSMHRIIWQLEFVFELWKELTNKQKGEENA